MKRRAFALGGAAIALSAFAAACKTGSSAQASGSASASAAAAGRKVIVAGGALTEIAFALGADAEIIAVDTSSTFPEATAKLPKIGYQRQLAVEGVLSLGPTTLLASGEAGPAEALEQIRAAGVTIVKIDGPTAPAGIGKRIREVGAALARTEAAERLATTVEKDIAELEKQAAARTEKPRVLFLYARGPTVAMVGGRNTAADIVIALAGCTNAAAEIDGFKAMTDEGATTSKPDVILIPEKGLSSLGGVDGLLAMPGLSTTPAAANKRVVAIDDLLLLGLGPRVREAVDRVANEVHRAKG